MLTRHFRYSVPENVKQHIDYITPSIKMLRRSQTEGNSLGKRSIKVPNLWHQSQASPRSPTAPINNSPEASLAKCFEMVTPACIRALYDISEAISAHPGNKLGILESGDYYDQEDLDIFFSKHDSRIPNGTHPILRGIDGGTAPVKTKNGGKESILDFTTAYPIIWPQKAVLYQTDDYYYSHNLTAAEGFMNTFLDAIDGSYCSFSAYGITGDSPIDPQYPDPHAGGYKGKLQCGVYKPTNVISVSYGKPEEGSGVP